MFGSGMQLPWPVLLSFLLVIDLRQSMRLVGKLKTGTFKIKFYLHDGDCDYAVPRQCAFSLVSLVSFSFRSQSWLNYPVCLRTLTSHRITHLAPRGSSIP